MLGMRMATSLRYIALPRVREAGDYDMQWGRCDTSCVARTSAVPTGERCVTAYGSEVRRCPRFFFAETTGRTVR